MYKACIDIGGTFTDCVILDGKDNLKEFKTPSTPSDFSQGVINTLEEAASSHSKILEKFISEIELIVHGTTVATNALVTRNVARTAMITTKGFRDIIEMRRALKIETKSMYEAFIPPYEPIIPRYLRFTVEEETLYTGEIARPLDEDELKVVIEKIKSENIEAVSICFINSYANQANERRAAQICEKELKDVFITVSSDILPKMGEYERESTCVINACVGPIVSRYMNSLDEKLRETGFKGQFLIIQANQFTQSVQSVVKKPVYLLGSGPAAAPPGASYLGKLINEPKIITADMGGTTLDAALINNGEVPLATGGWFNDDKVGIKVVDVSSIGAGGGSIAWFDSLDLLRVGPQSAAAEPGPACYNKGGTEPTVTDAAAVLGYLPTDFFCGGKVPLDIKSAKKAVQKIAAHMNISIEEAAQAIFSTINSNMAGEISRISTKMGYDIRDFSLLACGGGGPMCGAFWADLLSCKNAIIPNHTSSFSAWSMFTLKPGRDYLRSYISKLDAAKPDGINSLYDEMLQEALNELKGLHVSKEDLILIKSADFRYQGQYHEVEIELPTSDVTSKDLEQLVAKFQGKHEELYTFALPWVPIEIRNLRLIAKMKGRDLDPVKIPKGGNDPSKALKRKRMCFFNDKYVETPVYDSEKLEGGNIISGPAIIEVPTTTAVIPVDFQCRIDEYNNYILTRRSE